MKAILFGAVLVLISTSWAVEIQDVSQILDDHQCVPVRQEGRISSFACEGSLGEIAEMDGRSIADTPESLSLDDVTTQKLKLKIALSLNGKILARPQMIADLNQPTQFIQKKKKSNKEYVIEILPTIQNLKNPDFIQMKFKVTQNENGKSQILLRASVLGKTNQPSQISVQADEVKDKVKTVSIQVTPTWVKSQTL